MSVGVQRLRDEPERIRQGAIDKREDPSLVDRAIEVDAERRRLQAESGHSSRPSATSPASRSARRSVVGRRRTAPRSRSCARGAPPRASRIDAIDAELAATEQQLEDLLLRIPNPADPEVPVGGEEANVTVRTWGELRAREETATDGTPWTRRPHWELGRVAGHDRQRAWREGRGLRVPRLHGRRAAGSSAASSAGSSTSTRPSTASPRSGRRPS